MHLLISPSIIIILQIAILFPLFNVLTPPMTGNNSIYNLEIYPSIDNINTQYKSTRKLISLIIPLPLSLLLLLRPRPQLQRMDPSLRTHLVFQQRVDHPVSRGLHFRLEVWRGDCDAVLGG